MERPAIALNTLMNIAAGFASMAILLLFFANVSQYERLILLDLSFFINAASTACLFFSTTDWCIKKRWYIITILVLLYSLFSTTTIQLIFLITVLSYLLPSAIIRKSEGRYSYIALFNILSSISKICCALLFLSFSNQFGLHEISIIYFISCILPFLLLIVRQTSDSTATQNKKQNLSYIFSFLIIVTVTGSSFSPIYFSETTTYALMVAKFIFFAVAPALAVNTELILLPKPKVLSLFFMSCIGFIYFLDGSTSANLNFLYYAILLSLSFTGIWVSLLKIQLKFKV